MTELAPSRLRAARPATGSLASAQRARTDEGVRLGAGLALWAALLLVTYWWVADGGIQGLGTWAEGLVSVGRLTGLVASVLLLAQVLLMARVPALEQAFGQDRLARIHRVVGFTGFDLMVLHVVTVTWGYGGGGLGGFLGMLWNLTWTYPGMLLAVGGTACLVMVVVTSVKVARQRLRYESWHLLHLYAYLGVGLALPHQLWTGQQFLSSPARTLFWWTAWAVATGALVTWRVGKPLARNLRHQLRVTRVVPEAPGVVSVHLTGRRLDRLPVEAGQFLTWRFLGRTGWTRANPYSLSAAPDGRSLRITVQVVGDGSRSLARLRPGTRAFFEGPYGRLSARARTRRKVALIGAGVGMTPLRALAEGLPYRAGDAILLHRYTSDPLFDRELRTLARERGLHVVDLPGHRRGQGSWLGRHVSAVGWGRHATGTASDRAVLRHLLPDIAERDVYVCGPEAWTALVARTLTAAGLPPEQLHLETFAW